MALAIHTFAQDKVVTLNTLRLETRADYTFNYYSKDSIDHGFAGKYLNIVLDGNITDKFSYHFRQRINSPNSGFANTFFQGTDWAYLNWNITDNFYISGGKQVVAIGGWEYDTAPIDIYYGTEFWNHVCCYEMGVSLNYLTKSKNDQFLFQMSNSPFINSALQSIYAYNMMWYGNHGIFKTAYSVNMVEYESGHFINYISLGNKLIFNGIEMYLDVMNRASFKQKGFFGQDFTAIFGIGVDIGDKWIVFAKAGIDSNRAQLPSETNPFDTWVTPGKNTDFESIGFEYYPLGSKNVRLHLCGSHNNIDGFDMYQANIGFTWKVNLLNIKKQKNQE